MARQLARRQRRERLAGIFIAALGVVVLIVAVIALRHPKGVSTQAGTGTLVPTGTATSRASVKPRPTTHSSSGSSSTTTAKSVPLVVLNDTSRAGLAKQAAARFVAGGWMVTDYGNYQNNIISTCAYYDPAASGAHTAALTLQRQYPTIKRVVPKFSGLPAGPLVVVLTPDYSSG